MANLAIALRFASIGMRVFPCDSLPDAKRPGVPSKAPMVKWKDEATNNRDQIIAWWSRWPNALVGLVMGENVWCVDCDRHDPAADGVTAFYDLIERNDGVFPDRVPSCNTISGGKHFFFGLPAGFKPNNSRGRLPAGIDVRGLGGFVVAPGSACRFGSWTDADGSLSEMVETGAVPQAPDWLLDLIRPAKLSEIATLKIENNSHRNQVEPPALDRDELIQALSYVSADDRQTWVTFGAALYDTGASWAREVWDGWSGRSHKFNAADQDRTWKGFGANKYSGTRATVGSIFHAAKQHGYARPFTGLPDMPPWDGVTRGAKLISPNTTEPVTSASASTGFKFVEYPWPDPSTLPRRQWVYGTHLIRGFISVTVAPGGVGKSSLTMVEALAMASNRPLLGVAPAERKALNVALWNGEDPIDELERRMAGAVRHYGIDETTCPGGLFLLSGRDQPIVIAEMVKHDLVVAKPMVEAVKAAIIKNKLDVLVVDPFVRSHRVSENDNNAIDVVAAMWGNIANETGCAIDLVHHTRKGNGEPAGVDAARGASSLISAARSVRTLNPMTDEQADVLGVPVRERRRYFNVTYGKSSMSAASDEMEWRQLVSVGLGNFKPGFDEDHVGVVTIWQPTTSDDQVTTKQLREIQKKIGDGEWRENPQSTLWAGNAIAAVLGLDVAEKAARARVKKNLDGWIKDGLLAIEEKRDETRRVRKFVVMGRSIDHFNPRA